MAITAEQLGDILAPIIKRLNDLERRYETEAQQRESVLFEVVSDLGEIENPPIDSIVFNKSDGIFYHFSATGGWVAV